MNNIIDELINKLENNDKVKSIFYKCNEKKALELVFKHIYEIKQDIEDDFKSLKKAIESIETKEIELSSEERALNYEIKKILKNKSLWNAILEYEIEDKVDIENFSESEDNDFKDIFKIVYFKMLLLLYVSMGYFETDTIPIENINNHKSVFYRGHSNKDYKLLPSIYRNLKHKGQIDKDVIDDIYIESGFFDKYKNNIDENACINYDFISFMQHSVSYSPLLDFTSNKQIAKVFATEPKGNYNDYCNIDACVITFLPNEETILDTTDFKKIDIQYYKTKIHCLSNIFGKKLILCNLKDLSVEFKFLTYKSNNRMQYQKGAFLYFERCVIANNIVLIPWIKGVFTKTIIYAKNNVKQDCDTKSKVYKQIIQTNPNLDGEHLLNPYRWFEDYSR